MIIIIIVIPLIKQKKKRHIEKNKIKKRKERNNLEEKKPTITIFRLLSLYLNCRWIHIPKEYIYEYKKLYSYI